MLLGTTTSALSHIGLVLEFCVCVVLLQQMGLTTVCTSNPASWPDLCGVIPSPQKLGPQFFELMENMHICGVAECIFHPQARRAVTVHLCTVGDSLPLEKHGTLQN